MTRAVANDFTRKRLDNAGGIIGQIGVDIGPCGCKFCTFADQQTKFEKFTISDEELVRKIEELSEHRDLYGLFLMTMHVYDREYRWPGPSSSNRGCCSWTNPLSALDAELIWK